MKKYLFGILAIAMAVGFSAFTTAKKTTLASAVFGFTGDVFNEAEVEDPAFWIDITSQDPGCPQGDQFACKIEVEDAYYTQELGQPKVLNTSGSVITIVAEESAELPDAYLVDDQSSSNILHTLNGEEQ